MSLSLAERGRKGGVISGAVRQAKRAALGGPLPSSRYCTCCRKQIREYRRLTPTSPYVICRECDR